MAGAIDAALQKHARITEELLAKTAYALPGAGERSGVGAARQANAAAARRAFQHHRIADLIGRLHRLLQRRKQRCAWRHRYTCTGCQLTGTVFKAELTNLLRGGADKGDARRFAGFGKRLAF